MPTIDLVGLTDRAGGTDSLDLLLAPIFLAGDDDALNGDSLAGLGPAAILRGLTDGGVTTDAGLVVIIHALDGSDAASSDDDAQTGYVLEVGGTDAASGADVAISIGETIETEAGTDAAVSDDLGQLTLTMNLAGSDAAASTDWGEFAFVMPVLRDPTETEVRGTVNLVRNPSLEYEVSDLMDWDAESGITIERSDDDAWDGDWSVLATVDNGAAEPAISVRSVSGLAIDRAATWVGSVALQGDAAAVTIFLRLTYSDASTANTEATEVVPTATWIRYGTIPEDHDPAKTLSRIELMLVVPQLVVDEQALWLDAAQIEEDRGENATPYADGDRGDGYRWVGTPGFSASVREPLEAD
jgi:hypothetical protein